VEGGDCGCGVCEEIDVVDWYVDGGVVERIFELDLPGCAGFWGLDVEVDYI